TAEINMMGLKHSKFDGTVTVGGMNIRIVKVLDGDKGWIKIADGEATAMNDDEVAEEKVMVYVQELTLLTPLKDKAYKLSSLGEVKVGDSAALGLRVTRDGQRDVSLFFDKKTQLLLKSEVSAKLGGN